MKRLTTSLAIGAAITSLFFGAYAANSSTHSNSDLKLRLSACGSIPNGSLLTVVQTSRVFINLPRDYYPNIKLNVISHGASASTVTNGGAYGYAIDGQGKPNCWSYYFDFELMPSNKTQSGTVDISSRGVSKTASNYLIHFRVVANPPDATKQVPGNGNVRGQVVLGPVCPVQHNPPDPACAPRPFKTSIDVWSTLTGSAFKRITTNSSGIFNLSFAPGPYVLKAAQSTDGSPYPQCTEVKFSVVASKTLNVKVSCDTGIR